MGCRSKVVIAVKSKIKMSDVVNSSFNKIFKVKKVNDKTVQVIVHDEVYNSVKQVITKDLFFKTAATLDETIVLFGTNVFLV